MTRTFGLLLVLGTLTVGLALDSSSFAQEAATSSDSSETANDTWPVFQLDPTEQGDEHTIVRGPGWYLGIGRILMTWLLFAAWVKTGDWLNHDCQQHRLDYNIWNSVIFFSFFLAVLISWVLPHYFVAFALMLLAFGGSVGAYVFFRNQEVEIHERILTPEHLRHLLSRKAKKVGVKIDAESKADHEKGAAVEFQGHGDSVGQTHANLLKARQLPGFVPAKGIFAEVVALRGDVLMLDYSVESVAMQIQVDGVWHASEPRDRETADPMLVAFKTLAGLDPSERQARQSGSLGAEFEGKHYSCSLVCQGTETGERVVLKLSNEEVLFHTLESLGMRERLREPVYEAIRAKSGFVLFSAMPAGGLSSTFDAVLEDSDRLLRSFVEVRDVSKRERDIENLEVTTFDPAKDESPLTVLPEMIRAYPDAIVLRELTDADTVALLCKQPAEGRLVHAGIRAKDAAEALLRVVSLKAPVQPFAEAVTLVVNQRLIRKLCTSCRVAYAPPEKLLKTLGLPADRVETLFREPTAEEITKPCQACNGVGYLGRTAIFEVLTVNDQLREVLCRGPNLDELRKAARAVGMSPLQQEGVLLVARGTTSVAELTRMLKQ